MLKPMCCVRDLAVEAFANPFCVPHVGAATRSFVDEAKGDTPLAKHPADYELYKVGDWDDAAGVFVPHAPELLMRGMTAVEM